MAAKRPDTYKTEQTHKIRNTGKSGQPAANDAAKFRLKPSEEQYGLIARTIGCARFYWNLIIDLALITYDDLGFSLTIEPAEAKHMKGFEFLKEPDSLALSNVYANYQQAWKNFKDNPAHFGKPKHKTRCGLEGSYTTNNQPKWDSDKQVWTTPGTIRIENGKIQLPKVGWVEICQHYPLPEGSVIKSVNVSRDCAGRVFASINYYNPELARIMEEAGLDTSKDQLVITGLDYSNPHLFVNESGLSPDDVHFYKRSEAKLTKLQRKLARRKKGSANYKKLKIRIARLHRKIANQRKDLLHKLSHELAEKCDVVVVETLDMKAMGSRKHGGKFSFGKSVSDNAWGTFLAYLEYKLARRHGQLVKVGKWYPSSKKCHHCGALNEELELSDRRWRCRECGAEHDRDVNAAWNILLEGIRMLRAGEVAGVGISEAVQFKSAGGTPVTVSTSLPTEREGKGFGELPVEACKTEGGVLRYCSSNTSLRTGDADLREAGKKTLPRESFSHVASEAPTSAPKA